MAGVDGGEPQRLMRDRERIEDGRELGLVHFADFIPWLVIKEFAGLYPRSAPGGDAGGGGGAPVTVDAPRHGAATRPPGGPPRYSVMRDAD